MQAFLIFWLRPVGCTCLRIEPWLTSHNRTWCQSCLTKIKTKLNNLKVRCSLVVTITGCLTSIVSAILALTDRRFGCIICEECPMKTCHHKPFTRNLCDHLLKVHCMLKAIYTHHQGIDWCALIVSRNRPMIVIYLYCMNVRCMNIGLGDLWCSLVPGLIFLHMQCGE